VKQRAVPQATTNPALLGPEALASLLFADDASGHDLVAAAIELRDSLQADRQRGIILKVIIAALTCFVIEVVVVEVVFLLVGTRRLT